MTPATRSRTPSFALWLGMCCLLPMLARAQAPADSANVSDSLRVFTALDSSQVIIVPESAIADSSGSLALPDSLRPAPDTVLTGYRALRRSFRRLAPRTGMAAPGSLLPDNGTAGDLVASVVDTRPGQHHQRPWPDRSVEDLADELQRWTLGPQLDAGQIGQRQFLALDGIDDRSGGVLLDGEHLHNRLDGRSDLSWLSANLLRRETLDPWQRMAPGYPGGVIQLETRSVGDSVEVQVDWMDGFLGLVTNDVVASRPLGRGGLQVGTRQVYTHERIPGAKAQENLFFGHWEHPLPAGWLVRLDKRLLRINGSLLNTGDDREIHQNLNRLRLWQERSAWPLLLAIDAQSRWDQYLYKVDRRVDDRGDFKRLELQGRSKADSTGKALGLGVWAERQHLGSVDLDRVLTEQGTHGNWTLKTSTGLRWTGSGRLGARSDRRTAFWDLGLGLDGRLDGLPLSWQVLGQRGRHAPWPDQLWMTRVPGEREQTSNPWLRFAEATLLPDPRLPDTRWQREELRLGWHSAWPGNGQGLVSLRLLRLHLHDQPTERELADDSGNWQWEPVNRVQDGAQLIVEGQPARRLSLRFAQAWFPESKQPLSREAPTFISDGALGWHNRFFGSELDFHATLGAHHEYGAVNSLGQDLWTRPELWLQLHARRGHFTLWWTFRNLLHARNARMEGLPLNGYEEILGVRWDFAD